MHFLVELPRMLAPTSSEISTAPAFLGAARRAAACGGSLPEVFSVFRQWDGRSPRGGTGGEVDTGMGWDGMRMGGWVNYGRRTARRRFFLEVVG